MRSASWDPPKRYSTLGFQFPENRGPSSETTAWLSLAPLLPHVEASAY